MESNRTIEEILSDPRPIVLFDGLCNVCDSSVQAILKRDREGVFRFASLQGRFGQETLKRMGMPTSELETLVLLEGGTSYLRSTAVLRILRRLGGFWSAFYIFRLVPVSLRDAAYRLFARHRHRLFGRRAECRIPLSEQRERFID
jgi:predicted DCC family thiol-disulfide oxidoreductase YuxK